MSDGGEPGQGESRGPVLDLFEDARRWARETFGEGEPSAVAEKILEEARELTDRPTDGEEMADLLILLARISDVADVDLLAEARRKHRINTERNWDVLPGGVGNHVDVDTEEN